MLKIRWLMLLLGIAVLLPAILKGETKFAVIAFTVGLPYGLLIDFVGAKLMQLWKYAGQQWTYLMITVPCWGIFSMAINLIWNWIGNPWLAFIIITLGLFALLEIPNLKTKSWRYNAPEWLVGIGWIPLILSFRFLYLIVLYIRAQI